MYKVFVNNFPLFILDNDEKIPDDDNYQKSSCASREEAKRILEEYYSEKINKPLMITGENPDKIFQLLFSTYIKIEAAGGLVRNQENELLFIYRNGKWDLPKGKLDKDEEKRNAAVREVAEECGINGHSIIKELSPTWHVYPYKEKMAIKITYWYLMSYPGNEKLVPQTEEGITRVEWKNKNELNEVYSNTFESVKDVLREAVNYL